MARALRAARRRLRPEAARADALARAWSLITGSGGAAAVDAVAREVGYSRRGLTKRFSLEYGLGPKEAGRVARFERSHVTLKADPARSLAEVAVTCGYCDQSHMAREWNALAGCPPSEWLAAEAVPFVQADAGAAARS
jgi:transcriptional regulator GlxA family with amidase domain